MRVVEGVTSCRHNRLRISLVGKEIDRKQIETICRFNVKIDTAESLSLVDDNQTVLVGKSTINSLVLLVISKVRFVVLGGHGDIIANRIVADDRSVDGDVLVGIHLDLEDSFLHRIDLKLLKRRIGDLRHIGITAAEQVVVAIRRIHSAESAIYTIGARNDRTIDTESDGIEIVVGITIDLVETE